MKKRVGIFAFITAMTITSVFGLVPVGTAGTSDSATIVTVKAAAKKGFVKKSGKWYYYKNGKKVTGLKKLSGKYYYFDKKGVMASGKKTISGFTYYFNKAKDGKAPALVSKSKKISGKTWYFSAKGRGFYSVGDTAGDKAVALLWDSMADNSFGGKTTEEDKVRVVFDSVMGALVCKNIPVKTDTDAWYYEAAYNAISSPQRMGKCYHYAALTGLAIRACGIDCSIIIGQAKRPSSSGFGGHAWVLVNDKYVVDTVFNDDEGKGIVEEGLYFYKTYDELSENPGTTYKEENRY